MPLCAECGDELAVSTGPGRPRDYCSDRCRWRAGQRRRRWQGQLVPRPEVHDEEIREGVAAVLADLLPSGAKGKPEQQLAEDLLILQSVIGRLHRLAPALPARLGGRTGSVAKQTARALASAFPELARL